MWPHLESLVHPHRVLGGVGQCHVSCALRSSPQNIFTGRTPTVWVTEVGQRHECAVYAEYHRREHVLSLGYLALLSLTQFKTKSEAETCHSVCRNAGRQQEFGWICSQFSTMDRQMSAPLVNQVPDVGFRTG
jgi:hypothetical protein